MFAIIIGLIVIALVVTLLLKGYYPQAILFMGGVVLLTCTAIYLWLGRSAQCQTDDELYRL